MGLWKIMAGKRAVFFVIKKRATPVMERGGEILGEQDVRQSTRGSVKGKRKIEFSVEECGSVECPRE